MALFARAADLSVPHSQARTIYGAPKSLTDLSAWLEEKVFPPIVIARDRDQWLRNPAALAIFSSRATRSSIRFYFTFCLSQSGLIRARQP